MCCVLCSLSINIGFDVCEMDVFTRVVEHGWFSEANARPLVRQLLSAVAHMHACVMHVTFAGSVRATLGACSARRR